MCPEISINFWLLLIIIPLAKELLTNHNSLPLPFSIPANWFIALAIRWLPVRAELRRAPRMDHLRPRTGTRWTWRWAQSSSYNNTIDRRASVHFYYMHMWLDLVCLLPLSGGVFGNRKKTLACVGVHKIIPIYISSRGWNQYNVNLMAYFLLRCIIMITNHRSMDSASANKYYILFNAPPDMSFSVVGR